MKSLALILVFSSVPLVAGATCSNVRVQEIDRLMGFAAARTQRAFDDLPTGAADNKPNYTAYYGTYDSGRVDTVKFVLSQVIATVTVAQRDYVCEPNNATNCNDGTTGAWVQTDDPYKINFCERFFGWSDNDKESVIIHEITHFEVNGGADSDVADHHCTSDEQTCLNLAQTDPDKAVDSAYSHQFYTLKY